MLNGQLALLQGDARFTRFTQRIIEFAENLELIANTAAVKKELPLIEDIQTDAYWTDVTVEILKDMRRRLRSLAQLIEPKTRNQVVTNFADEIGTATEITLEAVGPGVDLGRFNMKARQFVEQHRDHIALQRLKRAEPLTAQDLRELERMLCAEAQVSADELQAQLGDQTLGMFLRSLAGMDRAAAQQAFSTVTGGGTLTAGQIEFINLIITHLVEEGRIDPARLFESPFTDIHVGGISELFPEDNGMGIVSIIRALEVTSVMCGCPERVKARVVDVCV